MDSALPPDQRPRRLATLAVLAVAVSSLAMVGGPSPAAPEADRVAGAAEVGLFAQRAPQRRVVVRRGPAREVGMRFTPRTGGTITGLRYFKAMSWKASTPRSATLWTRDGEVLARAVVRPVKGTGWRSVTFASAVPVTARQGYVVSVHTRDKGIYAATVGGFRTSISTKHLRAPADRNGVTRVTEEARYPGREAPRNINYWVDVRFVPDTSTTDDPTPTPTPTPPPPSAWPGPDNTGVPAGTGLTPYTGPCTITSARTLSAVDATGACDALVINTTGVIIEKSLVPAVQSIFQDGGSSVTITDSDVRAGDTSTGAVWGYNITARRLDVTGGQHSFQCNDNCEVTDSWLHDQYNPDSESYHNNAFISNGGENMVIRHNTLQCTSILNRNDGGCTADISLFGDFGPIDNVVVDNNFLRANSSSISYCAYGGGTASKPYKATNVRFTDNVFERGTNRRCGVYGPVTDFDRRAAGNVWTGNVWDTGGAVNP